MFLYGCGSGGCESQEGRREGGEWQCGSLALRYLKGKPPISHAHLSLSELEMKLLLYSEAWDAEKWQGRDPRKAL